MNAQPDSPFLPLLLEAVERHCSMTAFGIPATAAFAHQQLSFDHSYDLRFASLPDHVGEDAVRHG
jgi:hypothetical protein